MSSESKGLVEDESSTGNRRFCLFHRQSLPHYRKQCLACSRHLVSYLLKKLITELKSA